MIIVKFFLVLFVFLIASGCSIVLKPDDFSQNKKTDKIGQYYFGYKVGGINGLQVFDDSENTFINIPVGLDVESVWVYKGDLKTSVSFEKFNHSIKIPYVSNKLVVQTVKGFFVADRDIKLNDLSVNNSLKNKLLLDKLSILMAEAEIIKKRLLLKLESK